MHVKVRARKRVSALAFRPFLGANDLEGSAPDLDRAHLSTVAEVGPEHVNHRDNVIARLNRPLPEILVGLSLIEAEVAATNCGQETSGDIFIRGDELETRLALPAYDA